MDSDLDANDSSETALSQQLIETILSDPSNKEKIQSFIDQEPPLWYQTEDEGLSCLHAACYVQDLNLVEILLKNGAPWNLVDYLGNTAADIALSFNDEKIYNTIRDAGIRSELLLQAMSGESDTLGLLRNEDTGPFGSSSAFLESKLIFSVDEHGQEICSLTFSGETVGVMMGWERDIMRQTVDLLCDDHPSRQSGLRVLNIGFGLGIIDTMFQDLNPPPIQHTIIEPHKDVLAHMRSKGWYDKPGVKILEGQWQDFTEAELCGPHGGWDVIYIDTFAEGYEELAKFFDILLNLLNGPQGRFSFFNGLGATNATIYDVYTQISELHLQEAGLCVKWSDVDVGFGSDQERWGDSRKYFTQRFYRLPIATMAD